MNHISKVDLSPTSGKTETGKASHKGMVRALNEDSVLSLELSIANGSEGISFGLYAVADGVGGHEGGEIASNLALRVLSKNIVKSLFLPILHEAMEFSQDFVLQALTEGVKVANTDVYNQALDKGNDMGTTLTAALVIDETAYIANVGDSRVYLLSSEQIRQVTTDHSLVQSLFEQGDINAEERYTHPRRNVITRCLGTEQDIEVDHFAEPLPVGSSLILCSDGLWEMVRDDDIKEIVIKADNPKNACKQLVEVANQNGGLDNISVIVIKVID